jgi:tagatose 6-phosphate kinase
MILCVGPTPAVQRVMVFPSVEFGGVNRAVRTLESVAGKSVNVAKVLHALDFHPLALGFAGGTRGEFLLGELGKLGVAVDFVRVEGETRECVTVIDEAGGVQTELVEESRSVPAGEYERLFERVRHHVRKARGLVLSGTLTTGGPEDFYERCVRLGHENGLLTVVDAKGVALDRALAERPGLVKPNASELAVTVGRALEGEKAVIEAMQELGDRGAERVVVTAGGGPVLAWERSRVWRLSIPKVKVVNPIGSGDSFTAALVWRLLSGDDLGQACCWGAAAGVANAMEWMAGEVQRAAVERWMAEVEVEPVQGV